MKTVAINLANFVSREKAEAYAAHGGGDATTQDKVASRLRGLALSQGDRVLLVYRRPDQRYDVLASCVIDDAAALTWSKTSVHPTLEIDDLAYKDRVLNDDEVARVDGELARATAPVAVTPGAAASATQATPTAPTPPPLPETVDGEHHPENIILYGPPGTGKTFSTTRRALELLRVKEIPEDPSAQGEMFRLFQRHERVEFVTFHQSYGYEEFVEGLRPVIESGQVNYEVHPGVLKRVAKKAREAYEAATRRDGAGPDDFDELWRRLWEKLATPQRRPSSEMDCLLQRGTSDATLRVRKLDPSSGEVIEEYAAMSVTRDGLRLVWARRSELGEDATTTALQTKLRELRSTGAHGTALWVAWRALWDEAREVERKPPRRPIPQFVLVIDEINRGNISKILGELITLLEPDKRLGMPNALSLRLAYTPDETFALPPNLHVLGTMNTADRSIALIDVALRRRFTFEETPPRPELLRGEPPTELGELAARVLAKINARIRYLLDADHQIGHAYLLGVSTYEGLRDVFVRRVIPLLYEYFHGAPAQVAAVLGCPFDDDGKPRRPGKAPTILDVKRESEQDVFGFDDEDIEEQRLTYEVAPKFRGGSEGDLKPYFEAIL